VADATTRAVANGESGYLGTAMRILGGVNTSTATNNYGKAHSKAVDTGLVSRQRTASDILTLWGTGEIGANQTDTIALSVSYYPSAVTPAQVACGAVALVSKDTNGNWVNAVTLNHGGNPQFVFGPYSASYTLGTYGVDTNAGTVWAVVNYDGSFAAGAVVRRSAQSLASLRIATLSDIHYFATNLLINNGPAFQAYLAQDRKLLAEAPPSRKRPLTPSSPSNRTSSWFPATLPRTAKLDSHIGVSNLLSGLVAMA